MLERPPATFRDRKLAREAEHKRYLGSACKRCGGIERYTSTGGCVQCIDKRYAIRRAIYPDKYRDAVRRCKQVNPEKYNELSKQWHILNPERSRENAKQWQTDNVERIRQTRRDRRIRHPEQAREVTARYRSRGKTASPPWLKASGQVTAMRRLYAEAKKAGMSVDHDIPLAGCRDCGAVGLHILANLQMLPSAVNIRKGNRCMACFTANAPMAEAA